MSETEVVDPAENLKSWPECFGTWDENFQECTAICELRERCKTHKDKAPTPPPPEPAEDVVEELPDMDPKDYLIECLKGRYDLETKKNKSVTILNCRKNGKPVIQIRVTATNRYLMRVPSKGIMLQMDVLETVRQASELFKALLVV
jgi:hypothetical protein